MGVNQPIINEIAYRTWTIDEFGLDTLFLLEGEEKALLIDTGTGVFDIPALMQKLTDKPIIVAVTHGHLDHVGGIGQFSQIYIHPDDMEEAEIIAKDGLEVRRNFMKMFFSINGGRYDIDPEAPLYEGPVPKMLPIREGDVIRLGGRDVEVYETPGHTPGSICFLDRKERILFSGDACNSNTLLALGQEYSYRPKSNISDLLDSARKIESLKPFYDRNYNGHAGSLLNAQYLSMPESLTRDCIEACEGILDGSIKGKRESESIVLTEAIIEKIGKEKAELFVEQYRHSNCLVLSHGAVGIKYFEEQVK